MNHILYILYDCQRPWPTTFVGILHGHQEVWSTTFTCWNSL